MKIALWSLILFWALSVNVFAGQEDLSAGGVSFQAPSAWKQTQPHSQMRAYQFEIPAADDAAESGEMAVFFFGAGYGGAIEANIERWEKQFQPLAEGFTPKIEKQDVNGLKVTTVYLEGTYDAGMAMMSDGAKSNYAMFGIIAEGPQGPVFFKAMGPQKIISSSNQQMDGLIQSLHTS